MDKYITNLSSSENYNNFRDYLYQLGRSPPGMIYKLVYGNREMKYGILQNNNFGNYDKKIFPYIKLLLDFCSNPNEAIDLAFTSNYFDTFKLLLVAGGIPKNLQCLFDVVLLGFNEILELLLLRGISPNTFTQNKDKNVDPTYILEHAVLCNNIEAVEILLSYGATVSNTNSYYFSRELDYKDISKLLSHYATN